MTDVLVVDRPGIDPGPARAAAWAVTAVFAANGVLIGGLVVRVPSLRLDARLSDGEVGLTTASFGVAALLVMQLAGPLAARLGSAALARFALLALPVAMIGVGLGRSLPVLLAATAVAGAVHGCLDVAMNAHAVSVERATGRPVLNRCHAAWSIGGVAGSALGGAAAAAGVGRPLHYLAVAAVLLPAGWLLGSRLLPATADRRPVRGPRTVARGTGWSRRLLGLGLMGAAVLACDGAAATWSGVLLQDRLGASLGVAALGYLAFAGAQTAGRLLGDGALRRAGPVRLVRAGALLATAGLLVVVLAPVPALAIAGFGLLGLGLATPLPVIFGTVGHGGAEGPGTAVQVARLTTMTYAGILLAPPLIGWSAQFAGLAPTLAALAPLLLLVAAGAGLTRR
jgi:hypothetical protein